MDQQDGLAQTAELFRVLASQSRLRILRLLCARPRTVGALTIATGMPQPLVSQHLRTLRQTRLVEATRHGREVVYAVPDPAMRRLLLGVMTRSEELTDYHRGQFPSTG